MTLAEAVVCNSVVSGSIANLMILLLFGECACKRTSWQIGTIFTQYINLYAVRLGQMFYHMERRTASLPTSSTCWNAISTFEYGSSPDGIVG